MFHHHDVRKIRDHFDDEGRRHGDRRDGGIVLQHPGQARKPSRDLLEIPVDLLVGLEARLRRHHHAGRTGVHHPPGKTEQIVQPSAAHAHDDRHFQARQTSLDELHALVTGKLGRFAHDAENRRASHAAAGVEIHQAGSRIEIERAGVGEGCGGDDVHAVSRGIEAHERDSRQQKETEIVPACCAALPRMSNQAVKSNNGAGNFGIVCTSPRRHHIPAHRIGTISSCSPFSLK